jgi:hypothetical protein
MKKKESKERRRENLRTVWFMIFQKKTQRTEDFDG